MPFPLLPFVVGAAAGALTTYFLSNRSETSESSTYNELAESTDDKHDRGTPNDEDQQPERAMTASSDAE